MDSKRKEERGWKRGGEEEREGGWKGGIERGMKEKKEGKKVFSTQSHLFSFFCVFVESTGSCKRLSSGFENQCAFGGESGGLQSQSFPCCPITMSCSKFNMSPDSHLILTAGRQGPSSQICFSTIPTNLPFNNSFSPGKWSLTKL